LALPFSGTCPPKLHLPRLNFLTFTVKGGTIGLVTNFIIAIVNSLATFLSVFFGEAIRSYLPRPASNFLADLLFVCLGLYGLFADNHHQGDEEKIREPLEETVKGKNPPTQQRTIYGSVIEGGR